MLLALRERQAEEAWCEVNDVRLLTLIPIVVLYLVGLLVAKAFAFSYAYICWPFGVLFGLWLAFAVIATIYAKLEG